MSIPNLADRLGGCVSLRSEYLAHLISSHPIYRRSGIRPTDSGMNGALNVYFACSHARMVRDPGTFVRLKLAGISVSSMPRGLGESGTAVYEERQDQSRRVLEDGFGGLFQRVRAARSVWPRRKVHQILCGPMDTNPWTEEQGRAKEIADNDGIRQHSAAGSWSGITRRPRGLRFEAVAQTKPNPAQYLAINELLEELEGG